MFPWGRNVEVDWAGYSSALRFKNVALHVFSEHDSGTRPLYRRFDVPARDSEVICRESNSLISKSMICI